MADKAGGEYLAVDIGPQPLPLVAMQQLPTFDDLPSPARLLISKAGLGAGWAWVAYRSVGFAHRAKRLDVPERWVWVELVTLRIAGPWYLADEVQVRERVVVCWTRDLVEMSKASVSKRTGRRPENTGTWKSERWRWTSGLAGSIPVDVDADTTKDMIRNEAGMAARARKATGANPGAPTITEPVADSKFRPDPNTDDGRKQIAEVFTALDRTSELVGMLREAFEQLTLQGGMVPAIGDPGVPPTLDAALVELRGIVENTGHPALKVALDRIDLTWNYAADDGQDEEIAALKQALTDTEARAERLAAQVEELTEAAGECASEPDDPAALALGMLTELGAYVPVPKRWADVVAADIFVGRKGDLWVVDTPMGERDEFTKGKGTVVVKQGALRHARDFDPDDTARVLVPAAVEAAHAVLVEHLGASALLGKSDVVEAGASS